MTLIGITGGIGSGKSTVTDALASKGSCIIDADLVARDIVAPGSPVLKRLAETFGEDIIDEHGALRRAVLAARAFVDAAHTEQLNTITHPAITARTRELIDQAMQRGEQIIVHDSALLIELGLHRSVDLVVVVTAPEELRISRLVQYRGIDEDDARRRIAQQMSDDERRAVADVVLDNSGTREELLEQVDLLWERILAGDVG